MALGMYLVLTSISVATANTAQPSGNRRADVAAGGHLSHDHTASIRGFGRSGHARHTALPRREKNHYFSEAAELTRETGPLEGYASKITSSAERAGKLLEDVQGHLKDYHKDLTNMSDLLEGPVQGITNNFHAEFGRLANQETERLAPFDWQPGGSNPAAAAMEEDDGKFMESMSRNADSDQIRSDQPSEDDSSAVRYLAKEAIPEALPSISPESEVKSTTGSPSTNEELLKRVATLERLVAGQHSVEPHDEPQYAGVKDALAAGEDDSATTSAIAQAKASDAYGLATDEKKAAADDDGLAAQQPVSKGGSDDDSRSADEVAPDVPGYKTPVSLPAQPPREAEEQVSGMPPTTPVTAGNSNAADAEYMDPSKIFHSGTSSAFGKTGSGKLDGT